MEEYDNFDKILKARHVPSMRSNLPERIIAASLKEEQRRKSNNYLFLFWAKDFFDGFAVPRPAYAMAVVLIIGFFIGANPMQNGSSGDNNYFLQTQIQADIGDIL